MTTLALQPDDTAAKDTYIRQDNPTYNYGVIAAYAVGEYNIAAILVRQLVQFDLSTIPTGSTCVSAVMKWYCYGEYSSNDRTLRVYRMKQAWAEGTGAASATGDGATWNTYDGTNNWPGGAGAFGASDCEQTDIGSCAHSATESVPAWKTYNLTPSAIQQMFPGGSFTNNGLLIKADTEDNDAYVYRGSGYSTASLRPKFTVEYTEGGGSTVPVWLLQHRSIGIGLGGPHA